MLKKNKKEPGAVSRALKFIGRGDRFRLTS